MPGHQALKVFQKELEGEDTESRKRSKEKGRVKERGDLLGVHKEEDIGPRRGEGKRGTAEAELTKA